MPKRLAVGTSLGLFTRLAKKAVGRRQALRAIEAIGGACLDVLETRTLMSTTYYVAPWGADQAAGTLAQPFRTIQEAANVAYWGDTVSIEGGTYHETVKPPHAGVTFTNYNNQSVTISGADPITGFWDYSGSVYAANLGTNLGEGNEEVFVDGQLLNEARFPNTSFDPSHPAKATIGSYSNSTIYDSSLTQANGYWVGADINIIPGDAWTTYTGTVTASGPGWITVSLPSTGVAEQPQAGNSYYLFGKFQALDSAGEWYVDSSNHLFLWDQYGDNPSNHDVEVKDRQYGFDLSGVSNITVQGVNLFACTIHTDYASTGTTINGITATYITQYSVVSNGWWPTGPLGIELYGANSTLENSTIAYSATDGVFVGANNVTVNNNTIHDVDYGATDSAGVRVYGNYDTVSNNTIYNAGRDGINFRGYGENFLSNTIHDVMLQTTDGGGIYTYQDNGVGTVIAYNSVYNVNVPNNGLHGVGIYLDADSSNFVIHDNVTANVQAALKLNNTSYNEAIYNNKLGASLYTIESNAWPGYPYDWSGTQFYNNTYYSPNLMMGANVQQWSNTYLTGSPAIPAPTTTSYVPPTPPAPASPPPPPPPTVTTGSAAAASFVKTDTTTEGTWSGVYGSDGYSIVNGNSSLPSYAQLSTSGAQTWTWQQSSGSDVRTLQTSSGSGSRLAACDFAAGSFSFDLNLTDGKSHQVALYALNWDSWSYRNETITVADATTGAVLDSRNLTNFGNGQWLVWNLTGHVKITVTNNNGLNAVVSGIFFAPTGGSTQLPTAASFVKSDTTTQGTWTGVYGSDGYSIFNGNSSLPSYAQLTTSGAQTWTWQQSSGSDGRTLQTSSGSSNRLAACDFSLTSFSFDLNLTDGKAHQVSLYAVNWDWWSYRNETVTVTDATTGAVLNTRNLSNFNNGQWLVWNISGHVKITVTNNGGLNAVASGIFFK